MTEDLDRAEEHLKDAMVPFLCAIFTDFHNEKDMWTKVVSIVTEIDCLISLSIASGQSDYQMTRPELVPYEGEYEHKSLLDIKEMVHPCVQMKPGKAFIPNDTFIEPGEGG